MNPRRRLSAWKVLLGLLLGAAGLAGALALWVTVTANQKWDAMVRRIDELQAAPRMNSHQRPVLRGEILPGDAGDSYRQAILELKKNGLLGGKSRDYVSYSPNSPPNEVDRIITSARNVWREGTRKAEFHRIPEGPDLNEEEIDVGLAALISIVSTRALRDRREPGLAVEGWLDLARFAEDLAIDGDLSLALVSLKAWREALYGFQQAVAAPLSAGELREIERELALLDEAFPRYGDALLNSGAKMGDWLLREDPYVVQVSIGEIRVPVRPGWRYGWSMKLYKAQIFLEYDRWIRILAESEEKPWSEASAHIRGLDPAKHAAQHSVNDGFLDYLHDLRFMGRDLRAQLRILRAGCRSKAGGPVGDLDDPFGGHIRHTSQGSRLKIWSRGPSGIDHGGNGDWKPDVSGDILLEVSR